VTNRSWATLRDRLTRPVLTALLLVVSWPAAALQIIEVLDGQSAAIKVSAREMTRIAMADGGRIAHFWGLDGRVVVEPDRDEGQIFLRLPPGSSKKAFSFFIKDDQGYTYTILAAPVNIPADTVLLRPKNRNAGSDAGRKGLGGESIPYIERLKELMREMVRGAVPEGYEPESISKTIPLWKETRLTLINRYRGRDYLGEVYQLSNVSKQVVRVEEREFGVLAGNIRAVSIERHTLQPGETTAIYLIRGALP